MSGPARLSGSGMSRALACPPAYSLDAGQDLPGKAGVRGTAIHKFVECLQEMSRDEALALVPDDIRDTCEGIDVSRVPRGYAEHAYAWDCATDTARAFGKIAHREYPELGDTEIPMTIDLRYGPCSVLDWKTGSYEWVPRANDSLQLKLAMLAVARVEGLDEVEGSIVRIDHGGGLYFDTIKLDSWALDDVADTCREVMLNVQHDREARERGVSFGVRPGEHCGFCPAKPNCPAYSAQSRELAAPPADWLARFEAAIANDDGAAQWWSKLALAEEIVATMRDLLDKRAAARPFALPDGSTVREVVTKREGVRDADLAFKALVEIDGDTVAHAACETVRKTSKAAIEKAVRAAGGDPKRSLAVLRERGALGTSESKRVEAVR